VWVGVDGVLVKCGAWSLRSLVCRLLWNRKMPGRVGVGDQGLVVPMPVDLSRRDPGAWCGVCVCVCVV